jgi:hypothetical protein
VNKELSEEKKKPTIAPYVPTPTLLKSKGS